MKLTGCRGRLWVWPPLVGVMLVGCGGGAGQPLDQASVTCPTGRTLLDGVCVNPAVADYVACVRAQGAQLGNARSTRLSADVGAVGVRAGAAHEVSDSLEKTYAASDSNVGEIIRTCNRLAGGATAADSPKEETPRAPAIRVRACASDQDCPSGEECVDPCNSQSRNRFEQSLFGGLVCDHVCRAKPRVSPGGSRSR